MTIPAPSRSRLRTRRILVGALLATGTAAAVLPAGPASAAVPSPTSTSASATSPTTISVQWDAGAGGDEPTYYRIIVDNVTTAASDAVSVFASASDRSYTGIAARPSTAYTIQVCADDEVSEACGPVVNVTTPAPPTPTTTPPIPVGTGEWAPFFTVDAFIRQNYADFLGRAPKLDELNLWREALGTHAITRTEFLETLRREPAVDPSAAGIVRLYTAYFLRRPDFKGYEFWRNRRANGTSLSSISDFFATSSEFDRRYGSLDDAEFVSLVYRNVLGRNPESTGFSFWVRQLQQGRSRGWVMVRFSESNEFQVKSDVVVAATEIYADMLNRMPTAGEYDDYTRMMTGTLNPGLDLTEVGMIYSNVQNGAEYHARVALR